MFEVSCWVLRPSDSGNVWESYRRLHGRSAKEEWKFTEKEPAAVTDNAPNMSVAVEITRYQSLTCWTSQLSMPWNCQMLLNCLVGFKQHSNVLPQKHSSSWGPEEEPEDVRPSTRQAHSWCCCLLEQCLWDDQPVSRAAACCYCWPLISRGKLFVLYCYWIVWKICNVSCVLYKSFVNDTA